MTTTEQRSAARGLARRRAAAVAVVSHDAATVLGPFAAPAQRGVGPGIEYGVERLDEYLPHGPSVGGVDGWGVASVIDRQGGVMPMV